MSFPAVRSRSLMRYEPSSLHLCIIHCFERPDWWAEYSGSWQAFGGSAPPPLGYSASSTRHSDGSRALGPSPGRESIGHKRRPCCDLAAPFLASWSPETRPIKLYFIFMGVIDCRLEEPFWVWGIHSSCCHLLDLLAQKYSGSGGAERRFMELQTNNLETSTSDLTWLRPVWSIDINKDGWRVAASSLSAETKRRNHALPFWAAGKAGESFFWPSGD